MQQLGPATQLELAMIVLAASLAVEVVVLIAENVVVQVAEWWESKHKQKFRTLAQSPT